MLQCIIVDDEQNALDVLQALIQQSGLLQVVHATTEPLEVLQLINKQPIDLAFLDIEMPGLNGIEIAKALQGKCKVIFTTAYAEFVSDAYELNVVDYLLKPIHFSRFIKAVLRAIDIIAPATVANLPALALGSPISLEQDYFFVKATQRGKVQCIDVIDVEYVEGVKNYVAIHHAGQKTLALLNMKDMEEKLSPQHFVRVHKSFIVALHKIATVEGNYIQLKASGTQIPIGDTYKNQLAEAMKHKTL